MGRPWVALVGPEIEENLSLRYLASALHRAGVDAEILPFNGPPQMAGIVARITGGGADERPRQEAAGEPPPDRRPPPIAVGVSMAFQWRAPDMLGLGLALREAGYRGHLTVGGHFATFASEHVLTDFPEFDSVCRQEAEETFVALVGCLREGTDWSTLPGLCVRDAAGTPVLTPLRHPPELSGLAWPDRRGTPAACFGHPIAPLVSTRGCYANCSFCCIAAWHEMTLPGKRYRERPLEDVADEMAAEHFGRGIEIFVFHDDNFFLPSGVKNAERLNRLADLIEARGIRRFATVVKARPTDVQPKAFEALVKRLHCIRCYVGIETDADQGLQTLNRWAKPKHNKVAMELVEQLGLYTCFNVLLFDPDTTVASLEDNLRFMERWADYPFNFGRTELYAGTPLLKRMQQEGRAHGDWLQWDYAMGDAATERIFQLTNAAFHERNFKPDALANTMMSTRFDVEVVRRFHPEKFRRTWHDEARALSRALGMDSLKGLRTIIDRALAGEPVQGDAAFCADLSGQLRLAEQRLEDRAHALAAEVHASIGQGMPLTYLGDKVATVFQKARQVEVAP